MGSPTSSKTSPTAVSTPCCIEPQSPCSEEVESSEKGAIMLNIKLSLSPESSAAKVAERTQNGHTWA